MGKFCVITIGSLDRSIISDITDNLRIEFELIEIPFTYADNHEVWKIWKNSELTAFGGIGAGAAGCLLGHHAAWEKLSQSAFEVALVLESDAQITKYGRAHLNSLIEMVNGFHWNLIHLGTHEKFANLFSARNFYNLSPRIIAKELWERIYLRTKNPKFAEMQFPYSTHAYLIRKDAATFLSQQEINFMAPVDVILNSYSQVKGNGIFRCRTPLINQRMDLPSQTKRLGR